MGERGGTQAPEDSVRPSYEQCDIRAVPKQGTLIKILFGADDCWGQRGMREQESFESYLYRALAKYVQVHDRIRTRAD